MNRLFSRKFTEPAMAPLGLSSNITLSRNWELNDKLFKFTRFSRPFTLDMALRGIMIYGATGSGKSSSSGKLIATSYLEHGFGGLVLCAKSKDDELNNFISIAEATKRQKSIIEFGPKSKHHLCFNFIEFFRGLTKNKSENQASLVKILIMIANGLDQEVKSSPDKFWDRVMEQYLTHLLTLALHLEVELTFEKLRDLFDEIQTDSQKFFENFAPSRTREVEMAIDFLGNEFLKLNDKTRSVVVASVSSMLFKFTLGDLRKLFGENGNIDPSWCMNGAIIVINTPTQEFDEVGRITNLIWKFAFQKACLNRSRAFNRLRPVFLWADEAQEFISPLDAEFQATARSNYCASVYLTQNLSLMRLNLGSGAFSNDAVTGLESNMLTQIYHQNFDKETIALAQSKIGKHKVKSRSETSRNFWSTDKNSVTTSDREEFIYSSDKFANLASGGRAHGFKCQAIVYSPARRLFFPFKTHAVCTFSQKKQLHLVVDTFLRLGVDFITHLNRFYLKQTQ